VTVEHTCSRAAGPLLDHLARLLRTRAEASIAHMGLRPRHVVALTVLRDHGAMSQQAYAAALELDRTNLVGLLNELESRGLVARRRSPEDRRRHLVELTDEGARTLREAERAFVDVEDELLSPLDGEQRNALVSLLQQVTAGHTVLCTEDPRAG